VDALLNFYGTLDPALRRLWQTRRERLQSRKMVGARRRRTSQRRVTLRRLGQRRDASEHVVDATGGRGVLIGPDADRRGATSHEGLEIREAAIRLRDERVETHGVVGSERYLHVLRSAFQTVGGIARQARRGSETTPDGGE